MRMTRVLALAAVATLCLVGSGIAADYSTFAVDLESNENRGQVQYRKNCRSACHDGSKEIKALSPMDKMQDEWKAHAENLAKLPCIAKWPDNMTEADLSDIFSYLYGGAADSPTPTS